MRRLLEKRLRLVMVVAMVMTVVAVPTVAQEEPAEGVRIPDQGGDRELDVNKVALPLAYSSQARDEGTPRGVASDLGGSRPDRLEAQREAAPVNETTL